MRARVGGRVGACSGRAGRRAGRQAQAIPHARHTHTHSLTHTHTLMHTHLHAHTRTTHPHARTHTHAYTNPPTYLTTYTLYTFTHANNVIDCITHSTINSTLRYAYFTVNHSRRRGQHRARGRRACWSPWSRRSALQRSTTSSKSALGAKLREQTVAVDPEMLHQHLGGRSGEAVRVEQVARSFDQSFSNVARLPARLPVEIPSQCGTRRRRETAPVYVGATGYSASAPACVAPYAARAP